MSIKPLIAAVGRDSTESLDLSSPATLEALLAMRPPGGHGLPETSGGLPNTGQADSTTPQSAALDEIRKFNPSAPGLEARVLFIHSGTPEGTLAKAWVQRMLGSTQVMLAPLQENALQHVLHHQPQAVLIHFDPSSVDMATRLVAQLHVSTPHLPRVAVGHIKHSQCMLAALRCGVQDFLDIDGSIQSAYKTVRELLERASATPPDSASAPMTVILSARAGLGSSLLTSHLAWYLQSSLNGASALKHEPGKDAGDEALECLLIDLGNPKGDCPLYLNTPGDFNFLDAVGSLRRFDRKLASTGLPRHSSGLRTLSLPRQPGLLRDVSYADVDALVLRLRQYFHHVVADLGAVSSTHLAIRLALKASQIWVVCDQSIASVVSTAELLRQLSELQIERERLQLIVSRHDEDLALSAQQIAEQLQLPLLATIADRRKALSQAVNQGQLLAPAQRREPYVQAVGKLAQMLLDQHHGTATPASSSPARGLARFIPRIARS